MKHIFGSESDSKLTDASLLEEVDAAMRWPHFSSFTFGFSLAMDYTYNTQFYNWIHNENNVDYIAYYMRRIIADYEETNLKSVFRAIKWLVNEWSVQRTAELLVKLFYHWGIDCPRFASLIAEVVGEWDIKQTIELVVTLVIGERSSKVAQFIKQLTTSWSTLATVQLVKSTGIRLRWNERYFKHFLFHFASMHREPASNTIPPQLSPSEYDHRTRMAINHIRQRFQARRILLQQQRFVPSDTEMGNSCFSLVEFSTAIFERILSHSLHISEMPLYRPEPIFAANSYRCKNTKYPYPSHHMARLPLCPELGRSERTGPRPPSEQPARSYRQTIEGCRESVQYEGHSRCYPTYSGTSTSSTVSVPSSSLLEKITSSQPSRAEARVPALVFNENSVSPN
ncbi:hypothetical protein K493DRAFT_339607 [Basidiobolus meristosporus CBS 931.73]|uniref:Uncharacterized protein n=1 Tax=Basidiobolus meristosporus CBS 931.73 TaxID=1314790 RepID=A0A1Y1Y086_9FUNG|nr:hypothetical protein K493DRAFT_339607 [Basidiobolus meristosporus CBS 931.73]|eukprot:ORX91034.1 hypothetical protein K493DRAFT_339607 [Basidiobolus meristosporus CBS 931.73]